VCDSLLPSFCVIWRCTHTHTGENSSINRRSFSTLFYSYILMIQQQQQQQQQQQTSISRFLFGLKKKVARSFGDMEFKRFGVVATPDVRVKFRVGSSPSSASSSSATTAGGGCFEEFLVLACDGLWTRYTSELACAFLRQRLWAGTTWQGGREHGPWSLSKCCRALVEDSIFCKGVTDNCSCLVVQLRHRKHGEQRRLAGATTGGGEGGVQGAALGKDLTATGSSPMPRIFG